jgi:hypothetical protein
MGNVAAVWADARLDQNDFDIYAKRVVASGPTSVTATLMKTEAEPGRVQLEWRVTGLVRVTSVYRSLDAQVWESVGSPTLSGSDRVVLDDYSVQDGARYAYRLGYLDGGVQEFTAEVWVEVPTAHRFALAGVRPNPVVGDINVHFSLASADRNVASTTLGNPTPGNQYVRLADGRQLVAGVYWLRLRQGLDVAKSRVVVIR